MSIVVRRSRVIPEPRPRVLRFDRQTSPAAGAPTTVIDRTDPRHELARLALDLVIRTAEPVEIPTRWVTPAFGREVDRTRAHLAPTRTRAALIASFSREASIAATRGVVETGSPAGPVRVAYAIRWLELGDERTRPSWASFLAGPVDLVAAAALAKSPAVSLAGSSSAALARSSSAPPGVPAQRKGDTTT
jgi:hypothetical protein